MAQREQLFFHPSASCTCSHCLCPCTRMLTYSCPRTSTKSPTGDSRIAGYSVCPCSPIRRTTTQASASISISTHHRMQTVERIQRSFLCHFFRNPHISGYRCRIPMTEREQLFCRPSILALHLFPSLVPMHADVHEFMLQASSDEPPGSHTTHPHNQIVER
jgi:hypothetical protein